MLNERVIIRPALETDADALGRLGALMVTLHHEFDPARFLAATSDTSEAYGAFLVRQAGGPDAVVLVAEKEGAVVGYAYGAVEGADYMALRGPAAVLHDLIVHPDARRLGIGAGLLDAALADLKSRGPSLVVLSTAYLNVPARRLFATRGFRPAMLEMAFNSDGGTPAGP